jgi:hypothetical protein
VGLEGLSVEHSVLSRPSRLAGGHGARGNGLPCDAHVSEGYGRENTGSYIQFLRIAQGSLKELETHALLASRVGILPEAELNNLLAQAETTGKMLRSLIRSLEKP